MRGAVTEGQAERSLSQLVTASKCNATFLISCLLRECQSTGHRCIGFETTPDRRDNNSHRPPVDLHPKVHSLPLLEGSGGRQQVVVAQVHRRVPAYRERSERSALSPWLKWKKKPQLKSACPDTSVRQGMRKVLLAGPDPFRSWECAE